MKPYKTPILSSIFTVLGVIVLFLAGLWVFLVIIRASESRSPMELRPAIGVTLALVFTALIYFGISQVIDFLGRTAHSTERLCMLIETSLTRQIQGIEQRLSSATPILVRMDEVIAAAPSSPSRDGAQEESFAADNLKDALRAGVIADDTQVFRDDDIQWPTANSPSSSPR